MNYMNAIKRPFQDMKKLLIGILLMLIPVVNILGYGYFVECAKTPMKKSSKMPEWKNWTDLFVKGLVALVILLIYMIPVGIVLTLTIGTSIFTGLLTGAVTDGIGYGLIGSLATLGVGAMATLIVAVIFGILGSAAVMNYAAKGKFGNGFEFSNIFKKAFKGTYIVAWIVSIVYSAVLSAVLVFIPVFGVAISGFLGGVTMYTILAEAYRTA